MPGSWSVFGRLAGPPARLASPSRPSAPAASSLLPPFLASSSSLATLSVPAPLLRRLLCRFFRSWRPASVFCCSCSSYPGGHFLPPWSCVFASLPCPLSCPSPYRSRGSPGPPALFPPGAIPACLSQPCPASFSLFSYVPTGFAPFFRAPSLLGPSFLLFPLPYCRFLSAPPSPFLPFLSLPPLHSFVSSLGLAFVWLWCLIFLSCLPFRPSLCAPGPLFPWSSPHPSSCLPTFSLHVLPGLSPRLVTVSRCWLSPWRRFTFFFSSRPFYLLSPCFAAPCLRNSLPSFFGLPPPPSALPPLVPLGYGPFGGALLPPLGPAGFLFFRFTAPPALRGCSASRLALPFSVSFFSRPCPVCSPVFSAARCLAPLALCLSVFFCPFLSLCLFVPFFLLFSVSCVPPAPAAFRPFVPHSRLLSLLLFPRLSASSPRLFFFCALFSASPPVLAASSLLLLWLGVAVFGAFLLGYLAVLPTVPLFCSLGYLLAFPFDVFFPWLSPLSVCPSLALLGVGSSPVSCLAPSRWFASVPPSGGFFGHPFACLARCRPFGWPRALLLPGLLARSALASCRCLLPVPFRHISWFCFFRSSCWLVYLLGALCRAALGRLPGLLALVACFCFWSSFYAVFRSALFVPALPPLLGPFPVLSPASLRIASLGSLFAFSPHRTRSCPLFLGWFFFLFGLVWGGRCRLLLPLYAPYFPLLPGPPFPSLLVVIWV